MTSDRDFKHLVRARMAETGESYTTARAAIEANRAEAERFRAKTLRSFVRDRQLVSVPVKRKARVIVLLELLDRFEPDVDYPEKRVNEILGEAWEDYAYLRRELVDYGFLTRAAGIYRVADKFPEPGHTVADEIPSDAEHRFRQIVQQVTR